MKIIKFESKFKIVCLAMGAVAAIALGFGGGHIYSSRSAVSYADDQAIKNLAFGIVTNDCHNEDVLYRHLGRNTNQLGTNKSLRINKPSDRGIITGCANDKTLIAKTSRGVWFSLGSINQNTEGAIDNKVRTTCKIESITTGYNETNSAASADNQPIINSCKDIDAAYKNK